MPEPRFWPRHGRGFCIGEVEASAGGAAAGFEFCPKAKGCHQLVLTKLLLKQGERFQ